MTKNPLLRLNFQRIPAIALIASVLALVALAAPAVASAATYTVNSTGDQADESPGTGGCKTAVNTCTLRAAIEEANALSEADSIVFGASFNGEPADTIVLGTPLPAIEEEASIQGGPLGGCTGGAGGCIDIEGPASGAVLTVEGEGVSVSGLAISLGTTSTGIVVTDRATITGNKLAGGAHGVTTTGADTSGNTIGYNLIEEASGAGILLENDFNTVIGNRVLDSGAAGIRVHGSGGVIADENTIGGASFLPITADGDENAISGSAGPAIELNTVEKAFGEPTSNTVLRNSGSGNTGPFIDLVPVDAGTEVGPNGGIQPPVISTPSKTEVAGTAEPESRIRVFRKESTAVGELSVYLGTAVSDGEGAWVLTYSTPVAAGTVIAADQTPEQESGPFLEGTSELTVATTPSDPPPPSCATDPSLCPPSEPGPTPTPTPTPKPKPKPLKCKKGFVKKKVGGKSRCVKVKKAHKGKKHKG
jgi:CSLREA domain-containing protein